MTEKLQPTLIVGAPHARARGATASKAIKTRVNKLAHQRAVAYEQEIKAAITAQLQRYADEGLTVPALLAELDKMASQ